MVTASRWGVRELYTLYWSKEFDTEKGMKMPPWVE